MKMSAHRILIHHIIISHSGRGKSPKCNVIGFLWGVEIQQTVKYVRRAVTVARLNIHHHYITAFSGNYNLNFLVFKLRVLAELLVSPLAKEKGWTKTCPSRKWRLLCVGLKVPKSSVICVFWAELSISVGWGFKLQTRKASVYFTKLCLLHLWKIHNPSVVLRYAAISVVCVSTAAAHWTVCTRGQSRTGIR